jgi:hypothetical protein
MDRFAQRRLLLRWLAASPVLASSRHALAGIDRPAKLAEKA